ncbi:uncharacterized protein LOC108667151 [Hyalella azteca]|uniref:Uncharacterized protein LOC108667151 n=1 Tax=Hyalella azteca TaxID=294128 RepID=A0A8B7N7M4_HYAAZ|nr:uncharacterized protein LOC108667151 [Hyalella azteca]
MVQGQDEEVNFCGLDKRSGQEKWAREVDKRSGQEKRTREVDKRSGQVKWSCRARVRFRRQKDFNTCAVAADCPKGYEAVGSKCIHRYTGGYLTYDEAATNCTQHSGRLPVLKDCASFTDVATYVNDGYLTDFNNGYWLGATNATLTNVWQWSDGEAVQMGAPYWATNTGENLATEPSGGTVQNCAFIERSAVSSEADTSLLFRDFGCAALFYPMCSRPLVDGLCVNPFVLVGTQFIFVIESARTWHAARIACELVGGRVGND